MIFDAYRELLNFKVVAFNLDKLGNDTMRVAAFITAVNGLDERKIDHLAKGKDWDAVESACANAQTAFRALSGTKDDAVPAEVRNKYSLCIAKLEKERPLRNGCISALTNKVKDLAKEMKSLQITRIDDMNAFSEKLAKIKAEADAYCGENDRKLKEYSAFLTECDSSEAAVGNAVMQYYTGEYSRATEAYKGKRWTDELLADAKKKIAELHQPAGQLLQRYKGLSAVTSAYNLLKGTQTALTTLAGTMESDLKNMRKVLAALADPALQDPKEYTTYADETVEQGLRAWNTILNKRNFDSTPNKRLTELQAIIRKLKNDYDSDRRVAELNGEIKSFNGRKITATNYRLCERSIKWIQDHYNALTADEKQRVVGWAEFKRHAALYDKFCRKSERKRSNAYRMKVLRRVLLNWVSTLWIPVLLAGACIGLFFLMRANWYSSAPDWLFNHPVQLWGWRNWGSGTAFGVTNALHNTDIFILFKLVLYILTVLLDLFVYFLQAIWWILSLISWPIRWGLSRLLGLILYGLAYGLPGLLCAGACVGIGFCDFTYEKYWACHITNMVLCAGVTALAYVAIFVF